MKRIALLVLLTACATGTPPSAELKSVRGLVAPAAYAYVQATYYDRKRDVRNVVRILNGLDKGGWSLGVGPDSFPNSSVYPEFVDVARRLQNRERLVSRAVEAFRFPAEKAVRSEGVAYDPVDDRFYFSGGAAKLLRVDREGTITEFPIDPVGQNFGRLGMDVDVERRQIWVVSAAFDPKAPEEEKGRSAISVYDLRDGRLLRRVMHGSAAQPAFLNDLTLLKDGTALVTDTGRHEVVRLAPGAETFETWTKGLNWPNGIAISGDERTLYVADFRGIRAFDVITRSGALLQTTSLLNGIDGLIEHRGTLIGIQNVLGRPRVLRVHLNEANRVELLESKNPLLHGPSTGVAVGDEYFFMANKNQKDADRVVLRIGL
jgi:hypothetical protein